jgi:nucleoside-diphosphate-sugar epimerase
MRLIAANAKAKELTGWEPKYSLRDGLGEVIQYIQAHLDRFKPDIYNV